jgi:CBS domain-containing membrane protein
MFNVVDIMTTDVYTLAPDDSLQDARKLMTEHHVRHIPIVAENQCLEGILSQRDVLAAADSILLPHVAEAEAIESRIAISSVMTLNPTTTDEHASLRGAALLMQHLNVGCLPVVRDGILIGIVTDSDFVTVAINLLEREESVEPEESDLMEDFD